MREFAGQVVGLWRYPVKSLAGEPMYELRFDRRGAELDRMWGLVDRAGGIASGKTTRRFRKVPGLLRHRCRLDGEVPVVTLADGRSARVDTVEAARLVWEIAGPEYSIQRENSVSHFDVGAVHLITSSTLAALSAAAQAPITVDRLRPNVLLKNRRAGFPEDDWLGRTIHLGDVVLRITERAKRCVMVNHAQADLPHRRDVLKTIGKVNDAFAGVYADVLKPGTVRVGDSATLTPSESAQI
jgi:uncharacterized protein YcbX